MAEGSTSMPASRQKAGAARRASAFKERSMSDEPFIPAPSAARASPHTESRSGQQTGASRTRFDRHHAAIHELCFQLIAFQQRRADQRSAFQREYPKSLRLPVPQDIGLVGGQYSAALISEP